MFTVGDAVITVGGDQFTVEGAVFLVRRSRVYSRRSHVYSRMLCSLVNTEHRQTFIKEKRGGHIHRQINRQTEYSHYNISTFLRHVKVNPLTPANIKKKR